MMPPAGLRAVLDDAAADLEEVEARAGGQATEWLTAGIVFASVAGDRAEFRLNPAVVAAARRTPDTEASPRGPDWVGFGPAALDEFAVDRAVAWFASAWRRAQEG